MIGRRTASQSKLRPTTVTPWMRTWMRTCGVLPPKNLASVKMLKKSKTWMRPCGVLPLKKSRANKVASSLPLSMTARRPCAWSFRRTRTPLNGSRPRNKLTTKKGTRTWKLQSELPRLPKLQVARKRRCRPTWPPFQLQAPKIRPSRVHRTPSQAQKTPCRAPRTPSRAPRPLLPALRSPPSQAELGQAPPGKQLFRMT